MSLKVETTAHSNIALIKYWGKSDEREITPLNGSLSVTLDLGTTVTTASYSTTPEFFLNGEKSDITSRLETAVNFFQKYTDKSFSVSSTNNFPTAAGCASSASGAAAFVGALASLVGETENPIEYWRERNVDLSILARRVSGSGCRSLFGGFVEWIPGTPEESCARQVRDETYWKDFCALSVIIQSRTKKVSSTQGMQHVAKTVPWFMWRAKEVVPARIENAKKLIGERNFEGLSEIIMRESNELHANCAAALPPIYYMTDESRMIIGAVHDLNAEAGRVIAAYSLDAGANPFIFTLESELERVKERMLSFDFVVPEAVRVGRPCEGIKCKFV